MKNRSDKYTSGPWTISGVGPRGSIRKIFVPYPGGTYPIATVQLDQFEKFGQGDTDANARLIAAAPELLEALESILSLVPSPECQLVKSRMHKAMDIIAKARGES